ncbi:MAG: response regulator transcription factor [Gemmataceae bacterium]
MDDHPVVREGLTAQLTAQPDLLVCGEASDVAEALALYDSEQPDITVVDISLTTGNGIDLIKRLKTRDPAARVVVWSMYPESLYAERALRAGALGYVNKGKATREIVQAIRSVLDGQVYLSEATSMRMLSRLVGGKQNGPASVEDLSDREMETFQFLGQGLTTEQIAERMHVSPKTVETYRARIKEKLSLRTTPELIQRAVQWFLESQADADT